MNKKLSLCVFISLCFLDEGCSAPKLTLDKPNDRATLQSQEGSQDPFAAIQSEYFQMLDLRAGFDRLQSISAFAANLSRLADIERTKLVTDQLRTPESRQRAGLIFVYDALMTTNNLNAVLAGVLKCSDLTLTRRFSTKHTAERDELIARARYSMMSLELAAGLRTDDRRIDSWLAAARINLARQLEGKVSDKSLKAALDAVAIRPTFNLFTAIILFRGQPSDSILFSELANASKKFVDATSRGTDPCTLHPKDCANGVKSPFNLQASVTMLGDVFARESEHLLRSGKTREAMQMLGYAKGTYAHLQAPAQADATAKWPDSSVLSQRATYVDSIRPGKALPAHGIESLQGYSRVYECSSCHGRAATPSNAEFKIPEWPNTRRIF